MIGQKLHFYNKVEHNSTGPYILSKISTHPVNIFADLPCAVHIERVEGMKLTHHGLLLRGLLFLEYRVGRQGHCKCYNWSRTKEKSKGLE